MSYTKKQELLLKIRALIHDLNQKNENIIKNAHQNVALESKMLLATAQFLCNHIEILKDLESQKEPSVAPIQPSVAPVIPTQTYAAPSVVASPPIASTPSIEANVVQKNEPAPVVVFNTEAPIVAEFEIKKELLKPVASSSVKEQIDAIVSKVNLAHYQNKAKVSQEELPQKIEVPVPNAVANDSQVVETIASKQTLLMNAVAQKSVQDVAIIISLNDKWLFIKDLFSGNTSHYVSAIERLTQCQTYQEALSMVEKDFAQPNNWSEKEYASNKFFEILSRRFPQ